MMISPDAKPVR